MFMIDDFRALIGTKIPHLIKFLDDPNPKVRAGAINSISKLARFGEQCSMWLQFSLFGRIDDLRGLIRIDINPIIKLLGDIDLSVRSSAVDLVSQFTEFGEWKSRVLPLSLFWAIDDLHGLVRISIPTIIGLLKYPNTSIQTSAVNSISKLAEFGE